MIRGSCLCGGVVFEIEGRVSPMECCHCSRCRKTSGSAFSTALLTASRSFHWVKGRDLVTSFQLETGFRHDFCRVCGSPTPWPEQAKVMPVPAGCLNDDPGTRPFRHAFVGSKAPWFDVTDGLPQFGESAPE
jgi:hypothetical protein